MFCEKCGAKIEAGMNFCVACGTKVSSQTNDQVEQTTTEPAENYTAVSPAQEYSAPVPGYQAGPTMVITEPPVRKKINVKIPIFIAIGVLLLAAGIFLIIFLTNKANFLHSTMGDANYAHSVVMNTISDKKVSKLLNSTFQSASQTNNARNYFYEELGNNYSSYDYNGMNAEYTTRLINDALKTNGLGVTLTASAQLDEKIIKQIKEASESAGLGTDYVDKLLGGLNQFRIYAAEKTSDDALEYAVEMFDGAESMGGAKFRYDKDGTATLVLPSITDKGITMELPELSWSDIQEEVPEAYDLSKIIHAISENTKEVFENFEYEYESGSTTVNGVEFNGLTISIELDMDDINELASAALQAVADDREFIEYLASNMGADADDIEDSIENAIDSMDRYGYSDYNKSYKFNLEFYMNNDNTLAGMSFKFKNKNSSGSNIEFSFISNGKDASAVYEQGGFEYFSFSAKGTSPTDGTAKLTVHPSYHSDKVTIKADYKNFGVMEIFGTPFIKGDFEISLDKSTANNMFPEEIAEIVSDGKLLLSIAPNGKGASFTAGVEAKDFGKATVSLALDEPIGDVAPKPDNSYKLTDIDDIDDEFAESLMEDVMNYAKRLSDKGNVLGAVLAPTLIGYQEQSAITSVNATASGIKTQTTTFLTMMDTNRSGYSGSSTLDIIVNDGVWTVKSSSGKSNWRDKINHWGTDSKSSSARTTLIGYLADSFSDLKSGRIKIYFERGRVAGVVYVEGDYNSVKSFPTASDFNRGYWDFGGSDKAGKIGNTYVGTAPYLSLR